MNANASDNKAFNAAYGQLIALRKRDFGRKSAISMTIDSIMEEFHCSRRRAALIVTRAWADLEAVGQRSAYVDVSLTTGNTVVIHDTTGRTSVFSIHELLQLRDTADATRITV
ncbi:hypothetical protein [Marinobacter sp. X15-166B]|uniref:hypothetical protein n=1 Tax=Marinobacter sp. X15-166B TaxID=1897620 RepID=UPI00085BBACF|nr:hypothetical protein [Marinobacter sp. X15-166B]OEY67442.1 hypothetical protein BG841_14045 [Marinobacter sp. X15-166B]